MFRPRNVYGSIQSDYNEKIARYRGHKINSIKIELAEQKGNCLNIDTELVVEKVKERISYRDCITNVNYWKIYFKNCPLEFFSIEYDK